MRQSSVRRLRQKTKQRPVIRTCSRRVKRISGILEWKTHIGADSKTKLIHSIVVTPANCHDSQVPGETCCMEKKPGYGAILPIRDKKK